MSGYFDPIIASTAERLAALRTEAKPLLVIVDTPPDAILPARARAELVAGLACVDYVCEQVPGLPTGTCLRDEHRAGLARFIQHVHARQRAAASKAGH